MSSKTDSPPSYEDALKDPKCNNYPFLTQHGAPLPPPPSYSPSPGMCPGPGFPPPAMPIPTLSNHIPDLFLHSAVFFLVYCILICCKEPRRRFPLNLVLLGIFTVALSYMVGTVSSYYETKAVIIAMGITGVVCIAVTVFCFQTKVDFTSCGGFLCIAAVLLMIIGIVTSIVLSFQYVPWLHMLYAAIGAVVYTLFLVYNTQLLIGNRELAISPEEYIYGALSLYVDIVHIFLFILQVSGVATE
uniref:Transmembrane BAX inhibitor motif containing 1 n=1 Tax=Poecilia latipinna TaxID=48699 RepID=A0A3B3UUX0_9TELE